jgi:3-ketosteroid 9alpha-monooxygenase subunit B
VPPERQKPKQFDVVVSEVVQETPDTVSLVFEGDSLPPYRAGQFLTIDPHQFKMLHGQIGYLQHLKGGKKELVRAYSMCSAPHEPLAITIKEEPFYPGDLHWPLLSPLLVYGVPPGTRMQVVGFTGPYTLPPDVEQRTDHIVHLVAGSGVVPNWSILKDALRNNPRLRHTFIDTNKTWEDVIFREGLARVAAEHPDRVRLVHTLTRQPDLSGLPLGVRTGRVTRELLEELIADRDTALAYLCGPAINSWDRKAAMEAGRTPIPRFLESTVANLQAVGFAPARIKREAYG